MLGGSRAFFTFHDLAFRNQDKLTREGFESWAASAGVPADTFRAWLDSGRAAKKVDDDIQLAHDIGATGTPAFRINGVVIRERSRSTCSSKPWTSSWQPPGN
jgi:protein-disulfide isomerase